MVDAEYMNRLRVFGFRTPLCAFFLVALSFSNFGLICILKYPPVAFSVFSRRRRALNGLTILASVLAGERGDRQTFSQKGK